MDLQQFVQTVYLACNRIRETLDREPFETLTATHNIGHGGDVSIGADMLSEAILVEMLSPYGRILSEESGWIGEGDDVVIIDPIDGSDNFKSRFPYYGISIALMREEQTLCGVVCNLSNGDFIYRCDDAAYKRSLFNKSIHQLLTCNNSSKIGLFEKAPNHPEIVAQLTAKKMKFRAPGAVALSLSYAHFAEYVLFLGTMRNYDIAAGLHICSDLYTYCSDTILIVSKDKAVFARLCRMFDIDTKEMH
jgi:myo-inositol-1(or 4)-monophosphatase